MLCAAWDLRSTTDGTRRRTRGPRRVPRLGSLATRIESIVTNEGVPRPGSSPTPAVRKLPHYQCACSTSARRAILLVLPASRETAAKCKGHEMIESTLDCLPSKKPATSTTPSPHHSIDSPRLTPNRYPRPPPLLPPCPPPSAQPPPSSPSPPPQLQLLLRSKPLRAH